jgi:hypothetical protein
MQPSGKTKKYDCSFPEERKKADAAENGRKIPDADQQIRKRI